MSEMMRKPKKEKNVQEKESKDVFDSKTQKSADSSSEKSADSFESQTSQNFSVNDISPSSSLNDEIRAPEVGSHVGSDLEKDVSSSIDDNKENNNNKKKKENEKKTIIQPVNEDEKTASPVLDFSEQTFSPFPVNKSLSKRSSENDSIEKKSLPSECIKESAVINEKDDEKEKQSISDEKTKENADIVEDLTDNALSYTEKVLDKYEGLTELEQEILIIAETILKKKKHSAEIELDRVEKMSPLVEVLYNKCIAKLTHTRGFSKEDIFKSIQKLEEKDWIVTEQRRTKKEIVESKIHQKILSFLAENPGVHARDPIIEEKLKITRNPFLKHIMTLEAFGMIRTIKFGRTMNYFLADVPDIFDDYCVLFKNPLIPEIINHFIANSSENVTTIAENLDVYHGAIQYHIKKLIKMEILRKEKVDGKNYYNANKELLKRYNRIFDIPPFNI